MKKYFNLLKSNKLFANMTEEELPLAIKLLEGKVKSFCEGEFIYAPGHQEVLSGLVLEGSVHIIKEDFWGNRVILTHIEKGEMFGETYNWLNWESLSFGALAVEKTEGLFLDMRNLWKTANYSQEETIIKEKLMKAVMEILAEKNMYLNKKIHLLSERSIKQKLLSYLSDVSRRAGSKSFEIPFNRQELADFLAIDRSAMCSQLGKLKRDGIIDYKKNKFVLLEREKECQDLV